MIAGRQLYLFGDAARGIRHITAEIAPLEIDIDIRHGLRIFGADAGRSERHGNAGDLTRRHLGAAHGRHQHLGRDGLRIVAQVAWVAQNNAVTLASFDRRCHHGAAERRCHHFLNVADVEAQACGSGAVGCDLDIVPALEAFGEGACGGGNGVHDTLDFASQALKLVQIRPNTFTPTGVRMPVASISLRALIGMVCRPAGLSSDHTA